MKGSKLATLPTVLIVNDDPVQLRVAAAILARDGLTTISCLGAEEALRMLAQRGPVDIIVTDLYMPGIDGWRFCRLLRSAAYEQFNAIPILVVSATFSGVDAEELTVQIGADAFLSAPYKPARLCRVVRELLQHNKPIVVTNVLIVEPDAAEAGQLARVFRDHGYAVHHAASGEDALERFCGVRPQLVVIDYDHADPSTDRLIETMKEPAAACVVMVTTSDHSPELALNLIRRGADNYVHKPWTAEFLMHRCETAARQRALLRVEELLELRTRRLRDSEERYRNLFERACDGIVIHSLDGIVIAINRQLEVLTAIPRDELLGRPYSRLLTGGSYSEAQRRQEQARAAKERNWSYEIELARIDSGVIPVEVRCSFLPSRNDHPAMIMALYRDITEKKALERHRAEIAAMLAHDIRNPVGLILGCTELLISDAFTADGERTRKCHLMIREDARHLESLVNNFLDASRIEAGKFSLYRKPVRLEDLLQQVVKRFECESERRSIRIDSRSGPSPEVSADALGLERVFGNLLQNAFKFTPDGGVIAVELSAESDKVVIAVQDSGPGIEAEKLPQLFQKYHREEHHHNQGGVGLGLYIVKQMVEAHGGTVEVESRLGEGSCFKVIIPICPVQHDTPK